MSNEVSLYGVNAGIARKVFMDLEEFNKGRRDDTGFYAVSVATQHRSVYALWRIFSQPGRFPLYIQNLALTFEDAVGRAAKYLRNCNVSLQVLDNAYFEPYYGVSDDIISFGKYSGKRLAEIYYIDPHYVLWIANKFEPRNRKDERFVALAQGFRQVYLETVISKRQLPAVSRYIGTVGEKLKDLHLTVITVRLQVDSYKPDYFVDQHVLAADMDGNRFSFVVKAAARSLAPDILSCYTCKINVKEQLHLLSAKVLSHYESRGIRYTRLGYIKLA